MVIFLGPDFSKKSGTILTTQGHQKRVFEFKAFCVCLCVFFLCVCVCVFLRIFVEESLKDYIDAPFGLILYVHG